jgi:sugar O-acyltransferase (sialic acid O-acetyltransferase NeuD family)
MSANSIPVDAPLFILGAGGHGRVLAEAARALNICPAGFLDDAPGRTGDDVNGVKIVGPFSSLVTLPSNAVFALGVGDNRNRMHWAHELARLGRRALTLIHPAAIIASHTTIGEGAYVGPLAVVHVNASIGRHSIVNTATVVDHQCHLGDFAHASANVIMGGASRAGDGSLLGVGSSLLPEVIVGAWTQVGAGSVVTRDLPDNVVAYGVPARVKRPATP